MIKPINKYLDSVLEIYKEFLSKGEIVPLEFNFPSFKVTQGNFNLYALEFLSERVQIGVDTGAYGLQKYSKDIDYDTIYNYNSKKKIGLNTLSEDKTTGLIIEKILHGKIKQDTSITANELRNGAINGCCLRTMDYKVQELINNEFFKPHNELFKKEIKSEGEAYNSLVETNERTDFISTLVSMKEVLPKIYKQIIDSLNQRKIMAEESNENFDLSKNFNLNKATVTGFNQNKKIIETINELKISVINPNTTVLKRALEIDSSLNKIFIEKYPLVMKEVFKERLQKGLKINM